MKSCAGCHVGPDDECEAGCPASLLVNCGWSPEQAERILDGPGDVDELILYEGRWATRTLDE